MSIGVYAGTLSRAECPRPEGWFVLASAPGDVAWLSMSQAFHDSIMQQVLVDDLLDPLFGHSSVEDRAGIDVD
jgi:hypothetical protein